MSTSRERNLVDAFVELVSRTVDDYDVVDLLGALVSRSCALLGAADGGILLSDRHGRLRVAAASSERSRLISLMQLGAGEGPCIEAFTTATPVDARGDARISERWPSFAVAAREHGYAAVYAVPLRLRDETLGSLNLFFVDQDGLAAEDAVVAGGLADVATIGILQQRTLHESNLAREQLQRALDSRVLIEQAKGIIAQTESVDMEEAFRRLRERARSTRTRLSDAARELIVRGTGGAGHASS